MKKELNYIFLANTSGIQLEPVSEIESFMLGESVEIIAGSLSGAAGVVVNTQNEKSTIVFVTEGLGCAKVTVDTKMVKSKNISVNLDTKADKDLLMRIAPLQTNDKHTVFTNRPSLN